MKNKVSFLLAFVSLSISCSVSKKNGFNPAKKYSPAVLKEDISLLQKILESNHPSLYWYTSKDSVDGFFASAYNSLNDSLTELQFRNKLAWIINKIHCGHTMVRPSAGYSSFYNKQTSPQFPLYLKVWDDSSVVINNLFKTDSIIKRGTIITKINGISTKLFVDSMCEFISTDGLSNSFKYQAISFNFPAFYKNSFGLDSVYAIEYVDSLGHENKITLKNFEKKSDTALHKKEDIVTGFVTRKQLKVFKLLGDRNLSIDTSHTAYLSVNTFSEGRLSKFFRRSFKEIRKQKVKNLVVDLRLNTGGNIIDCIRLSKYLVNKPFHVADTVAAINRSFPYKNYIKPWFIYWLSMHVSGRKAPDERIHFRYFENHYFSLKRKYHFNGNIYVLTGGYTFSAATIVASNLKNQENVKVVGEETGGGAYGNTAMHITTIILPNSKLRISLPLYRMVLDASRPKDGRGIIPDIEVKPSSLSIRKGIDAKMEKVKQLIQENP